MMARIIGGMTAMAVLTVVLFSSGCGQTGSTTAKGTKKDDAKAEKKSDGKKEIAKSDTKHDGWWCQEHGVPEHMCSLCSADVEAKCKKDGDWCKIHERAQSQCFKCDPSKYAKFEAMHVAKFGKAPERPPEEEFKK